MITEQDLKIMRNAARLCALAEAAAIAEEFHRYDVQAEIIKLMKEKKYV